MEKPTSKFPEAIQHALEEHDFVAARKSAPDVVVATGQTRQEILAAINTGSPREACIIYPRKTSPASIIRGNPSRRRE